MVKYGNLAEALIALELWLKTQKHLPIIDKQVQKAFIQVYDGDLEETKRLIDLHYTIRTSYPHIFIERDPRDEIYQNVSKVIDYVVLPDLTPEGYSIHFSRLVDPNPENFLHTESVKYMLMLFDSILCTPSETVMKGLVSVFDMKGFSLKHMARYNFLTLKIFMKFAQDAAVVQTKQIHIFNCPSFIDKLMLMVKPLMNAELLKVIHFHQPNSETIFESISRDLLPSDIGGTNLSVEVLKENQQRDLFEKRDYLMDRNYWIIDESKRPAKQEKYTPMEGNFRNLSVD